VFKDAVLAILAVIGKQERIRRSERTVAGLEKARKQGRIGGRPRVVADRNRIAQLDSEGWTVREIGEELGISAASVSRLLSAYRRPQNGYELQRQKGMCCIFGIPNKPRVLWFC
jgi:DNA invertase Pin-like site-specific DNA recombinase